ncbi:unnamed protein product, partial [Didymodactylos carnosus]
IAPRYAGFNSDRTAPEMRKLTWVLEKARIYQDRAASVRDHSDRAATDANS